MGRRRDPCIVILHAAGHCRAIAFLVTVSKNSSQPSWAPSTYASKSHALIFLPSNNGITFDLDAIRRANPGFKPVRFVATVGNTEIASEDGLEVVYADIWVLVDGQVRFRRREINKCSGVFPIAFSIAKEDRFLTLVSTDGGNDAGFDWIPIR